MTAKEIAERYAGQTLKCKLTKSKPVEGIPTNDTGTEQEIQGRVFGWKAANGNDPAFVLVEVLPPGKTHYTVSNFTKGCHNTYKADKGSYAKRLLQEEIVLPSSSGPKHISEWPHKCRDCGSPAQILFNRIDCSNEKCRHKFSTRDASDLFVPKDMRPVPNKPKSVPKIINKPKIKTKRAIVSRKP